jgi:MoxR-like ATPase
LATQNPIEQEGTYPLPEAQLDRFMFFIHVNYPTLEEERRIARETTGFNLPQVNHVVSGEEVMKFQELVMRIPVPEHIYDTVVDLVRKSRPRVDDAPDYINRYVSWGAGPRAVQYIIKGAKAHAVLHGNYLVGMEDVEAVAYPVLNHRILTNFQAQSEGITSTDIITRLLDEVRKETNNE